MRRIATILVLATGVLAWADRPDMPPVETPATRETVPPPVPPAPPTPSAPSTPSTPSIHPVPPVSPAPPRDDPQAPPPEPARPETAPLPTTAAAEPPATGLRLSFVADHPSGLYYAKEEARVEVTADLPRGSAGTELAGSIQFGLMPQAGGTFKPLTITPITESAVTPGQRLKLPVSVTFPAPGNYTLRMDGQDIRGAGGAELRCIFAPRGIDAKSPDTPWISTLPPAATEVRGFLADFSKRTGIRRFVLDETWGPERTRDVKVLTRNQRETLLASLAESKATLVLRLALTPEARADSRHIVAMNNYVSVWVSQAKGSLAALSLDAGTAMPTPEELERFRTFYLSAYDAAKRQNKSILMLGVGSIVNTDMFLVTPPKGESLRTYVDVLAAEDRPADVRRAMDRQALKIWAKVPVWVLPERQPRMPAAVLKALGVAVIPVNIDERNVPAHLLGGAVLTERLHPDAFPCVSVFQGDGFAVGAIAGPGAGTLLDLDAAPPPKPDATRPALGPPRMRDETGKAVPACLELADDTKSMRVVDASGNAVNCRVGDMLNVPLGNALVYVLASGAADDLTSLVRTATPRGFAAIALSVTAFEPPAADAAGADGKFLLKLHNTGATDIEGEVALVGSAGDAIGEPRRFVPISSGKNLEVTLSVPAGATLEGASLELRFKTGVQSHALIMPKK